jgi:hypothetical protein
MGPVFNLILYSSRNGIPAISPYGPFFNTGAKDG